MFRASKFFIAAITTLIAIAAVPAHADANWPAFRGADARGISENAGLPVRWSVSENVEWKTDLPGRGWSSPVVWGGRVFLTTVVNLGESEAVKKGLYFGGNRPEAPGSTHRWKVFCLELDSGKILWQRQVHEGKPFDGIHIKNSYASETPVADGERVYFYFGNVGVFCFDFDGNPIWTKMLEPHKTRYGWGTAASPVLHRERLYIVNDNEEDSYLLALDKKTGEEIWRAPRDEKSNWSTPYVWENGLRTEIVTPGTGKVRSYDLDGKLLWSLQGMSSITIATPYARNGLVYISSGYIGDKKHRPLYAIRPGAEGDVTLAEGETANDWIAWSHPFAGPYNPSTILYRDRLYVLQDRGFVYCYDAASGKPIYENARLPKGSGFTTSPWAYGGKLFFLNEDGKTFVVKAGDAFELLHANTLTDGDMGMATPAMAGGRLLIRTSERLYCIRKNETDPRE